MRGKWKETKINMFDMPTVHDSMIAGSLGIKQQGKEEKLKYVEARHVWLKMTVKAAKASLCKDPVPAIDDESEEGKKRKSQHI